MNIASGIPDVFGIRLDEHGHTCGEAMVILHVLAYAMEPLYKGHSEQGTPL